MTEAGTQRQETFERSAAVLLERFEHLWQVRDAELIREIVLKDAVSHWPRGTVPGHVRATVGGDSVEFDGIDRFRLRGEQADEVHVVFDPGPIGDLLGRAAG